MRFQNHSVLYRPEIKFEIQKKLYWIPLNLKKQLRTTKKHQRKFLEIPRSRSKVTNIIQVFHITPRKYLKSFKNMDFF